MMNQEVAVISNGKVMTVFKKVKGGTGVGPDDKAVKVCREGN